MCKNLYKCFCLLPLSLATNVLNGDFLVSKLKLHFRTSNLGNGVSPLVSLPPSYGLNSTSTDLQQQWL